MHSSKTQNRVVSRAWLLTLLLIILACSSACVFSTDTKIRELERELEPVLSGSNARSALTADPQITGDALWDDYCTAVAARFAFIDEDDKDLDAALVPDEILAAWEPEFGKDERYWELRYCLASCGNFEQSADGRYLSPTDFLREAQERGIASANTLLLLYLERNFEYDQLISRHVKSPADPVFSFGELGPPEHLPLRPEVDREQIAETLSLHDRRDQEALNILNAAVEAGADEAWPLYLRAMHWLALGEYERGLADLDAGNQTPWVIYPQPFPINYAADALVQSEPSGGPAVCGAVLVMAESYPQREYTPVMSLILDSLVVSGLSGDTQLLNAWHSFLCRSPAGVNNSPMPYYVSLYLAQQIADYWEEANAAALSEAQRGTLQRARGAINSVRRPVRRRYREFYNIDFTDKLTNALGDRGYYVAGYLSAELVCRLNLELLKPALEDITGLSYPGLADLEQLEQYEPLTVDEVKRRRETEGRGES